MATVMLYGATGYSGRLIVAAARRRFDTGVRGAPRLLLGARDRRALDELASRSGHGARCFALDDRSTVLDALRGVDVVLNAAGPFAATAPRLARAALSSDAHYVDLCGEPDVYRALDDLAPMARARERAMVCGAGRIAAVSDVLIDRMLTGLGSRRSDVVAMRIAHARVPHFSRGSLRSSLRSLREQVTVVRNGVAVVVPVGQLERVVDFDFEGSEPARRRCLVTATSFLDTLVAQRTAQRHRLGVCDIDSAMEMGDADRLGYELGALGAGWWMLPWMQRAAEQRLRWAPEGPSPEQRQANSQRMVVELENRWREVVQRCRAETPDPYAVSADLAWEVAVRLATTAPRVGWLTPAEVFQDAGEQLLRSLGVRIDEAGWTVVA